METAKISVIVPIYKVEKYLKKCVDSIINQTYTNLEIILVEDGSPDNSGKICDEYAKKDGRIKVIHKENCGLSDARNVGIEQATGDYIATVDSDDYIDVDFIEVLYNIIKEFDADMSVCSACIVQEDDSPKFSNGQQAYVMNGKEAIHALICDKTISVNAWDKLYKKELFKGIKYPKGLLYEDLATTYKLIDRCQRVCVTDAKKYAYVQRKSSIMGQTGYFVKKDKIHILAEMIDCFKRENEYDDEICAGIIAYIMNDIYKMSSTGRLTTNTEYLNEFNKFVDNYSKLIFENRFVGIKEKIIIKMCRSCTRLLQFIYSIGRKK